MDMELEKKPNIPIIDIDGYIENGKEYDLEIKLPEDNRNVMFGVVKNCYNEPIDNAVVKLIEVIYDCGKEERRPVTHTFTDEDGEFVFGPLCPGKEYALEIFVNDVKHVKICAKGKSRDNKCLKGIKLDKCDKKLNHEDMLEPKL
ncbi:MAG: carboxypeptidase regulatory-like domain-containing protein [Clostridia bacterium]|nr:carboxypeptidase regulatory-like domain-containing protein [Clostridia bacterium]